MPCPRGELALLGHRNTELAADLAGEEVDDLALPGDGGVRVPNGMAIPRMAGALPYENTSESQGMCDQGATLHEALPAGGTSRSSTRRPREASARGSRSRNSTRADKRLSRVAFRVRSCACTPGTAGM